MKTHTKEELNLILDLHKKWLNNEEDGKRADLNRVDLSNTNLRYADLRCVNLSGADLSGADLSGANLKDANLNNADLSGANLSGANLSNTNLSGADLSSFKICPEEGSFIGYKKVKNNIILTLEIPEDAGRINSIISRKCRASKVKVIKAEDIDGNEILDKNIFYGLYNDTEYKINEITEADSFNDDIRLECSNGIHFFITKNEAREYIF